MDGKNKALMTREQSFENLVQGGGGQNSALVDLVGAEGQGLSSCHEPGEIKHLLEAV